MAPDPCPTLGGRAVWEARLSRLHEHHADEPVKGTGGREGGSSEMGSSPSNPSGCHFTRSVAVIQLPRTELIITILHVLRYKHAFAAILLTAPYGHLGDWVGGFCYHFQRKKQESCSESPSAQVKRPRLGPGCPGTWFSDRPRPP